METQTHMVQSTITNVNSSLIELDKKQGSLKHKYIHLLSEVQAQQKETGILQFKTALAQKLTLLNVILSQYAYETDTLENIVNSAVQGFIHSSLLDASVLRQQLKEIKIQLPIGEGLPINLNKPRLSELIRSVSINVVHIDNMLIFIMELLLVNNY